MEPWRHARRGGKIMSLRKPMRSAAAICAPTIRRANDVPTAYRVKALKMSARLGARQNQLAHRAVPPIARPRSI
jgi:hypothetical protein